MIECTSCDNEFDSDDIRWYGDDPYCENCFFDRYTYCSQCDEPVNRDCCRYDSNDDPICDDCFEEDIDNNAPDNPEISDAEREQIVTLSKSWLKGERSKTLIRINRHDLYLSDIQEKAGLVSNPIYLYGLIDRDDYQIRVSHNIFNQVSQHVTLNNWGVTLEEGTGVNRLGISRSLRENKLTDVIELIKEITSAAKTNSAAA